MADAGEAGAAADSAAEAGEAVDSAALAAAVQAAEVRPVAGNNRVAGDNVELLKELVTKLEHAFSDRLVSVILYGSAASPDHPDRFSDLNVLCVLKQVMPRELMEGEPVLKWWREKGHPWPLLMSEDEVHNSADSFPIEFHDMKERRRVLYGLDVIADLTSRHAKLPHAGGARASLQTVAAPAAGRVAVVASGRVCWPCAWIR